MFCIVPKNKNRTVPSGRGWVFGIMDPVLKCIPVLASKYQAINGLSLQDKDAVRNR